MRPPVIIEAPRNPGFISKICMFAVRAGFSPLNLYLQARGYIDINLKEGEHILEDCRRAWERRADIAWLCTREGEEMTEEMRRAEERYEARVRNGQMIVIRRLFFDRRGVLQAGWNGPLPSSVHNTLLGERYRG